MRLHPALAMAIVWLLCAAGYGLLPFHLVDRELTWHGGLLQAILIAGFCAGSILASGLRADAASAPGVVPDTTRAQHLLMVIATIAIVALLLDTVDRDIFDLAASYHSRSESADALLKGEQSDSTVWFQIAFVTYPASYAFSGLHLLYAPRIVPLRLALFGLVPFILAGMVMGGRTPILYGLLLTWLAFRHRRRMTALAEPTAAMAWSPRLTRLVWTLLVCAALAYFAQVFLVRADSAGGATEMFDIAQQRWGIAFSGPMADTMFALLGMELSYLVFIFVWYGVQGLVIGNELLFTYAEPAQWGAYGIDIFSALLRRLDPERLASGFDALMELGAYGFFPSAWGSLFVDFRYGAIAVAMVWGAIAGLAYHRIVIEGRMHWHLVGPFISIGILFSTINTPLGFSNGLVTHVWLLVAFVALRRSPVQRPDPADTTRTAAP